MRRNQVEVTGIRGEKARVLSKHLDQESRTTESWEKRWRGVCEVSGGKSELKERCRKLW